MATHSSGSTTLTLRMRESTKARLERLAQHTQRTKSFLANAAIADYVDPELAIVEGVNRGLADMKAGNVLSHESVMDELDAIIDEAEKAQR